MALSATRAHITSISIKSDLELKLYFDFNTRASLAVHLKKQHYIRDMAPTVSRRTFMKVGLIGAIALTAAGGIYRTLRHNLPLDGFILDEEGKSALRAIATAMLKNAIPLTPPRTMDDEVTRIQRAIAGLPINTQKEIQDLFGLLVLGPTRRLLAGIPNAWQEAKADDVTAFLQSWRMHRFGMLQSAYHALHDLIIGAWYADESTWPSIGYPGPIKELS